MVSVPSITVAWDSSVGLLMLAFLAEGIFLPLLAAYLITLVAAVIFLFSGKERERRPRDPVGNNSRYTSGKTL